MVSVFTSAKERVDATVKYMAGKCPNSVTAEVKRRVKDTATKKSAGSYIKLGLGRDSDQRRALRSLLLCQYLYVVAREDDEMGQFERVAFGTAKNTKDHWKNRSEAQILSGVKAYEISGDGDLAEVVESLGREPGDTDFSYYAMTRDCKSLGAREPICYKTIALALWLGGYASVAWLSKWHAKLNAGNCFTVLGAGDELESADGVLRGDVISFRAVRTSGPLTVNHWMIAVSKEDAIGSNTDGFLDAGSTEVGDKFEWGRRRFGKFDVETCLDACNANTKYRDNGGVRIARHPVGSMQLW